MSEKNKTLDKENKSVRNVVIYFPIIILIAGGFGLFFPNISMPLNPAVPYLLGLVMFTMGLTITAPDLKIIVQKPQSVIIGFLSQYLIMPLTGLGIGILLNLDPLLIVGLVLLGSVPGGASSNIVAYLAKGNVALSVAMTTLSTLLAPIVTPFILLWLVGSYLPVSFWSMFIDIMQMVLVPVALGLIVRVISRKFVEKLTPIIPWISVFVLALVIAGIMAGNAQAFLNSALIAIFAVILHNTFGFLLGYFAAKIGRLSDRERRTVAIEVGMQNAGLAAALANTHFSPLAALPAAIATIWHNIGGALFSFLLGLIDNAKEKKMSTRENTNKKLNENNL